MKPISNNNERWEEKLKDLSFNVKQIQDNLLEEILTPNLKTEYLQRFHMDRFDKELFKKNVPVVTYEDIKPYIDRVVNGESSDVISNRPITGFLLRYIKNLFLLISSSFLYKKKKLNSWFCIFEARELQEVHKRWCHGTTSTWTI